MILVFDIGNTRTKVSLACEEGIFAIDDWQKVIGQTEMILVSNVAGDDAIPQEIVQHKNCKIITWQSEEISKWLKDVPAGMGADRLAADIGARSIRPNQPLLIIDAGTCLTFDVIDRDGCILGGSISPGINLRLKAMHDYTAALPLLDAKGEHPVLGYDTPTAMRGGAINGMKWEIEGYIRYILETYPDLHVFFTGGDITELAKDLEQITTCDSLLVQKGLLALYADKTFLHSEQQY